MNVLPYSAFDVLAMVMAGTHLPSPVVVPPVVAETPAPVIDDPIHPELRKAA